MKILAWLNGLALVFFITLGGGAGLFYWYILPNVGQLSEPPSQAWDAIQQVKDIEPLRDMAETLFGHLTSQTKLVNGVFKNISFYIFVHFILVILLAMANLVIIYRNRKFSK